MGLQKNVLGESENDKREMVDVIDFADPVMVRADLWEPFQDWLKESGQTLETYLAQLINNDVETILKLIQRKAEQIEVTVTMDLSKNKYESFRRMFDAQTERYFFSNCMDGHLDEMNGDNPDLMADYLKWQNERLYGEKEEA